MSVYQLAPKSLFLPPWLNVMSKKLSFQLPEKFACKRIGMTQVSRTKQRNMVKLTSTLSPVAKFTPTMATRGSASLMKIQFVTKMKKLLTIA